MRHIEKERSVTFKEEVIGGRASGIHHMQEHIFPFFWTTSKFTDFFQVGGCPVDTLNA